MCVFRPYFPRTFNILIEIFFSCYRACHKKKKPIFKQKQVFRAKLTSQFSIWSGVFPGVLPAILARQKRPPHTRSGIPAPCTETGVAFHTSKTQSLSRETLVALEQQVPRNAHGPLGFRRDLTATWHNCPARTILPKFCSSKRIQEQPVI